MLFRFRCLDDASGRSRVDRGHAPSPSSRAGALSCRIACSWFLATLLTVFGCAGCDMDQRPSRSNDRTGEARQPSTAQNVPTNIRVRVTGHEFQWHILYPGPDGRLDTSDDVRSMRHLRLPVGTNVTLDLKSEDYIYTLALPHLRLKEIAVPDLDFSMVFETRSAGTFPLLGDQMCGYTHPKLIGTLLVEPRADFESWCRQSAEPHDESSAEPAGS